MSGFIQFHQGAFQIRRYDFQTPHECSSLRTMASDPLRGRVEMWREFLKGRDRRHGFTQAGEQVVEGV